MRRVWPLTVRGTGALAIAVACFVAANQLGLVELVWFGVLLLALVIGCAVAVAGARGSAEVMRRIEPAVPDAGEDIRVTAVVTARSARPSAGGAWRDALPEGIGGAAAGVFPPTASGLGRGSREVEIGYDAVARRRGIHWIGPLEVRTCDPFGIARRRTAVGEPTRLVVTPAVVELLSLAGVSGRGEGALERPVNRLGQGADDVIARPWAPGDSMRRIHWRASAHRDELMVRQEEQESSPAATVVLDRALARFSDAALEGAGADAAFEAAISLCASALARLSSDGYAVALIEPDGGALCEPIEPHDAAGLEAAMLVLATVQARLDDRLPALAPLFAGSTTGPLVLITGRLEVVDTTPLATVGHRSSCAVLLAADPAPDAFAAAGAWAAARFDADIAGAWRSAVAERATHAPA